MRKFKRSKQSIVSLILLVLFFFYLLRTILCAEGNLSVYTIVQFFFFLMALFAILIVTPPDFEYFIRFSGDWVVFEFSDEDHRKIDKNFAIVSQKRHYIVLDDGFARIAIAYNKEVLQFLNEINN